MDPCTLLAPVAASNQPIEIHHSNRGRQFSFYVCTDSVDCNLSIVVTV